MPELDSNLATGMETTVSECECCGESDCTCACRVL